MRREKSLALVITLAAALTAAESPPDRCHSPKTVGPCRASFHRWWYNATSQMCQEFIFGGCKGNANNFVSEQDCFQMCIRGGAAEATVVPCRPATEVATPRAGHPLGAYENRPDFREITEEPGDAGAHPHLPSERFSFSTRAVVLAVLLAILVTILLGSMGVFFVKICRKNPELSVGTVWSTLDDKEYLMSNAYTL